MTNLKSLISELEIPEKRKKIYENKLLRLKIKHTMSDLTLNKMVALYARNLDTIAHSTDEMVIKNTRLENIILLKKEPMVDAYESLRQDLITLDRLDSEYYQSIQIDLREALLGRNLPEIYVYQGMIDRMDRLMMVKHIIIPGTVQSYHESENNNIVVYPENELTSNRKLRHFYNNVSFRYLENLTEDYSFDLEGKNLGRVKIK